MNDIAGLIAPVDEHNTRLIGNVHPTDWVNPEPKPIYNMVVIGAGTAGLVTAIAAAGLGAKVALVERHLMGGDCLNVGCVPSKCLIHTARLAAQAREAVDQGVGKDKDVPVDFGAVMERMRRLRADISHLDSAQRFSDSGVDVFIGDAEFTSKDTVKVGEQTLRFKRATIATGARAFRLPIPGLEEAGFLTNETVFSLTERPARLVVIGTGPIGCEMAQTFQRLASQVTVIEKGPQVLPREDRDAANIVSARLEKEGVKFIFNADTDRVDIVEGEKRLHLKVDGKEHFVTADEIFVAVGRQPNVENLGLEAAGVKYDTRTGVEVNDFLETSTKGIYAAGDVSMKWKFTHAADFAARTVIQNALFSLGPIGRKRLSALTMPWCTYTEPEIAHVGLYPHEADEQGIEIDSYTQSLEEVDRAILEDANEGFVKVHVRKGTDKIVGATIVAANAGDMISEVSVAIVNGIGLKGLGATIHPYPTQADAIRKVADQFGKTRLTPMAKKVLAFLLRLNS